MEKVTKSALLGVSLCKIHGYQVPGMILLQAYLPKQWKESISVPIYKKVITLTVVIIEGYRGYQLHTKFNPIFFSQG
jgi:hypothetical protein